MNVTFDSVAVQKVFAELPDASLKTLWRLMEGGAIDFQREIRKNSPVHDGQYRASVRYKLSRLALNAEVGPGINYAKPIEEGSRPHWVSVKEGSPLRKWADDKGINPWAVQHSIAKKGTKAQHIVGKTFNFNHRRVESDIVNGFGAFIAEVNRGRV